MIAKIPETTNFGEIMSVVLTEKAATEIKRVIETQEVPESYFVRIGVAGGGCSGLSYSFGFAEEADPSKDIISEQHGLRVAVDRKSELYLDGTIVDFYEGLEKRGFEFKNPNSQRSCGCGSSFSV